MRHAGNFNPEWGYLAPTPSFARTVRIAIVAAAIGATGGAAVVFSLVDRPAAEETVAARTLAPPADPASSSVSIPGASQPSQQLPADETRRLQQADARNAPHQTAPGWSAHARVAHAAPSESGSISTTQRQTSAAALAEAPAVTDVAAPAAGNEQSTPETAQAQKKPVRKPALTWRTLPPQPPPAREPLALLRPFGAQY